MGLEVAATSLPCLDEATWEPWSDTDSIRSTVTYPVDDTDSIRSIVESVEGRATMQQDVDSNQCQSVEADIMRYTNSETVVT